MVNVMEDFKYGIIFILKIIQGSIENGMEEGVGNLVQKFFVVVLERDDEGQIEGIG